MNVKTNISSGSFSFSGQFTTPAQPIQCSGRLSLISGLSVPESDVTGAVSIYYAPHIGNVVPIYDGSDLEIFAMESQLSLQLDADPSHSGYHAANINFDLFVIDDNGTLRLGSGPGWTSGATAGSDVMRGTGAGSTELEVFNGLIVNKNPIIIRFGNTQGNILSIDGRRATYVGSFRPLANGQATDKASKRLLFNAYNRVERSMFRADPAGIWTYNVAAYRQANGNADNQLEFLIGLPGISVEAQCASLATITAPGTTFIRTAIGLDNTSQFAPGCIAGWESLIAAGSPRSAYSSYRGCPGLGRHVLTWLEKAGGFADTTWYGSKANGVLDDFQTGINGSLVI